LGSTGLQVSAVGLGCNNFGGRLDLERTRLVVDAAIAAGITFIDTADAYGNRGGSERLYSISSDYDQITLDQRSDANVKSGLGG
jgi:aryl-alcohol dehydrogenase-like predicted oxidoreductase